MKERAFNDLHVFDESAFVRANLFGTLIRNSTL